MMRVTRVFAIATVTATLTAVMAVFAVANSAGAAPLKPRAHDGWCDRGEACFYYNSNLEGGVYDSPYSAPLLSTLSFVCSRESRSGGGTLCAGSGRSIWNNVASVYNQNSHCDLVVYFNHDWHGRRQLILRNKWANLNATLKNNNASHQFVNC